MKKQKNNLKTDGEYLVKSADWSMYVKVDETIFDDPHVEACTRCVEEKMESLEEDEDFLVNPVIMVNSTKRKNAKVKLINTYKILLNAGCPDRAEILRKIFYMNTSVDLAEEPLSASKY